jgi:hypothetical protein
MRNAILKIKSENLKMNIEEIEIAISNLSDNDFLKLRNWVLDLDYQRWDEELEADIQDGKLDSLAEKALTEFTSGQYQEI